MQRRIMNTSSLTARAGEGSLSQGSYETASYFSTHAGSLVFAFYGQSEEIIVGEYDDKVNVRTVK
jgi:hypothetical protein